MVYWGGVLLDGRGMLLLLTPVVLLDRGTLGFVSAGKRNTIRLGISENEIENISFPGSSLENVARST